MTDTTPLTGEELAAITRRAFALTYALDHDHIGTLTSFGYTIAREDIPRLVAEVERLRAILGEIAEPGYHAIWINDDGTIAQ